MIYYKLELLSPVLLTNLKGEENLVASFDEISGSYIIGALAKAYLSEQKNNIIPFNNYKI